MAPPISITPPLLNSASPWATSKEDLQSLYDCPHTGAVTTRTTLLDGFPHNPHVHQHTFFSNSSLNTYGYSPHPLSYYLAAISEIIQQQPQKKPFIISVTGTSSETAKSIDLISAHAHKHDPPLDLYIEINLSCPNIPGALPPAYSRSSLQPYISSIPRTSTIPIGLKTPPYTHAGQYDDLFSVLAAPEIRGRISFLTATNTLGGCLVLDSVPTLSADEGRQVWQPALSSLDGTGIGGVGGDSLHSLALGNVYTLRNRLDQEGMKDVVVIGVGGVRDIEGMARMVRVGAGAVGVATAFGREGIEVFGKILTGVEEEVDPGVMGVTLPPD